MKNVLKSIFAVIIFLLTGCAVPTMSITGIATGPIPVDSVKVYLKDEPSCEYDEVGLIEVPGDTYGMESLLTKFKIKAAEFGADGVDVSQIEKNGIGEYRGTAIAIRCKNN